MRIRLLLKITVFRFGLSAVKNVGRAMILNLVNERKNNGEFKNFSDFIDRMAGQDMNKRALEGLISCGAFDSMGVKTFTAFGCLRKST